MDRARGGRREQREPNCETRRFYQRRYRVASNGV
jgi:hypothetical protein